MRKSSFFRRLMTAGLVAGVLASMLPGGVTPVGAADRAWSSVSFPGSTSTTGIAVGTASNVRDNANIVAMGWASDGQTGYALVDRDDADGAAAWDEGITAERIAKTTNGGRTWSYIATTAPSPGDGTHALSAIAVSPDGQTVVVGQSELTVAGTKVWRSTNGGSTFGQLGGTFTANNEVITSIALSPDYANDGIVLVGTADPDANDIADVNSVWAWNIYGASFWRAAAGTSTTENNLVKDVVAVAFSPAYATDKAIFALSGTTGTTGIAVDWAYQDSLWNDAIGGVAGPKVLQAGSAALITDYASADPANSANADAASHTILGGSLAFPSDFNLFSSSRRTMFAGLNLTQEAASDGTPAAPAADVAGVYRAKTGSAEAAERLGSVATNTFDVHSLSLTGSNSAPGTLFVGMVGTDATADTVRRTTRQFGTVTDLNWLADGVSSDPALGTGNAIATTIVMAAPDFATSNKVYAATNSGTAAAANEGTGFSVSENGGANWHNLSLLDVAVSVISDIAVSGNTLYVGTTGTGPDSLWRSTDAGSSWRRVDSVEGAPVLVAISPNYATDGVVYLVNGGVANAQVRKSVDSGATFTAESAPGIGLGTATAVVAVDSNTLLVGSSAAVLRRSVNQGLTWSAPTVPTTTPPATRISHLASMGANVLLGDAAGNVFKSTDSGSNWSRVGSTNVGAASDTAVVFDPSYATTGVFYAVQDGTIDRWGNHVTAWSTTAGATLTRIDATANTVVGNPAATGYSNNRVAVSAAGVLYTGDSTVPADIAGTLSDGIRRSHNPTARIGAAVDNETTPLFSQMNNGLSADATTGDATTADVIDGPMVISGTKLYSVRSSGTDAIRTYTDTAEYTGAAMVTGPANETSVGTVAAGGTTINAGTITLSWPAVTGATAYDVQLDNDSDFSSTIDVNATGGAETIVAVPVGSSATSFSVDVAATTLQANTKYYWRVRALIDDVDPQTVASADVVGKWSAPAVFVAGAQAGAGAGVPALTLPVLGAIGYADQPAQPTFVWTAVNNATGYELQVSTDGTFADATKIAINKTGDNRLSNQLAYQDTTVSLAANTTYFWRVRAYISSTGVNSAWSPASAFRTTNVTSSTTAVSPTVALAAAEATGKLEVVTAFDYSSGTYQAYVPGLPGNKLTTISPNSVIFVTLKQNATVVVSGVSFDVKANTPTPLPVGSTVSIAVTLK